MDSKKVMTVGLIATAALLQVEETPTVSNVKVRQKCPWNGMVNIYYTSSGGVGGAGMQVFL